MLRPHTYVCGLLIGFFVAGVVPTTAQRVANLDFTLEKPKDRKRQPTPFPPGTMLGGRCGGIVITPALTATLISLDKIEYALGDEVVYTLKLTNSGKLPLRAPIRFNLADMEPEDPNVTYTYEPMEVWLRLRRDGRDVDGLPESISTLLLTLYGSNDQQDTQIELRSGEWLEVRGRAKLEATSKAKTKRKFFADTYVYSNLPDATETIPDLKAMIFSWRGDVVYFDGVSHHEVIGCRNYEMSETRFDGKIALLPSRERKNK